MIRSDHSCINLTIHLIKVESVQFILRGKIGLLSEINLHVKLCKEYFHETYENSSLNK